VIIVSDFEQKNGGSFAAEASKTSKICFEWVELIAQSLIVVVFALAFFFRIFTVSGDSMLNTLHNGDKVVVWRWNYTPESGDVVVVRSLPGLDKPIIKRVIATEGQSVRIDVPESNVYVDEKIIDESRYRREPMKVKGDNSSLDVPKGHSFVMGDNRNNSLDSRFDEVGPVDNTYIIGKAVCIYFPFYRIQSLRLNL
jgi:signal peptidase I